MNHLTVWHCACRYAAGTMRLLLVAVLTMSSFGVGATALKQAPNPVQGQGPVATFKSSIDLVRINAVVRDKKGRFVSNLNATDFEVEDGGVPRQISEFRHDQAGVSVAMLFDVSGSMEDRMKNAREAATHILSWLKEEGDEAAIFTFDTRLTQISPFRSGMTTLPDELSLLKPFGATSLHDAIARTAQKVAGARVAPPRRRGLHRRERQRQQAHAGRSVRHRQLDRCAGLHHRHRAVDRQSVGAGRGERRRSFSAGQSADQFIRVDWGPYVRSEYDRRAQPDGAPAGRRTSSSVSDRIRGEHAARLASTRRPHARQRSQC